MATIKPPQKGDIVEASFGMGGREIFVVGWIGRKPKDAHAELEAQDSRVYYAPHAPSCTFPFCSQAVPIENVRKVWVPR